MTQRELQDKLSSAHQKLQTQAEQNSDLQSELERLRLESAQLRKFLEGQVFSDSTNGVLVREEEDDEDAVLLSVTSVFPGDSGTESSVRSSSSGSHDASYSSCATGHFLGGSISKDFEILQSYFDPSRHETRASTQPPPAPLTPPGAPLFSSEQSIVVGNAVQ